MVSNFRDKLVDGQEPNDDGGEEETEEGEGTFDWDDNYILLLILPGLAIFALKRLYISRRNSRGVSA